MQRTPLYYFLIIFIFLSCQDLVKERIIENYYLVAADDPEGTCLSYHESSEESTYGCIIEATVFAVGYNSNYLIVKQHPSVLPNPPDKKITNYYILPIKNGMNWSNKNGLIGPLTIEQFIEKRNELNIPESLTFTIEIEDLK